MRHSYRRLGIALAVSGLAMYAATYLNTYSATHVWYSQSRQWMALIMVATMAFVMLGVMWHMYERRRWNVGILTAAALVFLAALWLERGQRTVDDVAYLKAMIPHHSIAVLTSKRAQIRDPRVRELADQIIESQLREIAQMEHLIAELEREPVPSHAARLPPLGGE